MGDLEVENTITDGWGAYPFRDERLRKVPMHYEELFEPIEVVTYFREGKIIPLKFRWNGRIYMIRHVHGQWKERQGYAQKYHFSIQSDGSDFFELLFDSRDFSWQLARVCLEG